MGVDKSEIRRAVLTELARQGQSGFVPIGISARHVHLTEADIETLFGKGYKLTPIKKLSQPGQFAAREQVTVIGRKGRIEHVRVLGPARSKSQVEVSVSDSFVLGEKGCPIRLSGDLDNTPGVRLLGPNGLLTLDSGLIVAARHLHMNDEQARAYGIHDKQIVSVKVTGARECVLENIICRTGAAHELELHLDTDEANACGLKTGDLVEIMIPTGNGCGSSICRGKETQHAQTTCPASKPAHTFAPAGAAAHANAQLDSEPFYAGNPAITGGLSDHLSYAGNPAFAADGKPLGSNVYYSGNMSVGSSEQRDYVSYNGNPKLVSNGQYSQTGDVYIGNATIPRGTENQCRDEKVCQQTNESIPEECILDLVTEADINDAFRENRCRVYCSAKALITPAATDRAFASGVEIVRMKGRA